MHCLEQTPLFEYLLFCDVVQLFLDDEEDSGFREAETYARENRDITDVKSAAEASSKAAVAASAAFAAVAMTKAAAARAAHKAQQAAMAARSLASLGSMDEDDLEELVEAENFDSDSYSDDRDIDQLNDEEDLKFENETGAVRSSTGGIDDFLEDDSEKLFQPAADLEGPELADVLAKVKANLGENISSVVGEDELASQLSILRTEETHEEDAAGELSDAYDGIAGNQGTMLDKLPTAKLDGQTTSDMRLWGRLQDEGYRDGSNFDMPGPVPLLDDHEEIGRTEAIEASTTAPPFVFHADEEVTEIEPPEAVPTPFLSGSEQVHVGSYTKRVGGDGELSVPTSDLFKDVAASVTALESKLSKADPNQEIVDRQTIIPPENADANSLAAVSGEEASDPIIESEVLSLEEMSKKRKRGGDVQDLQKSQWITNLWQKARRKKNENIGKLTTDKSELRLPLGETEATGSREDSHVDKVPWWAIVASVMSFRRGKSEQAGADSQEAVRVKSTKKSRIKRNRANLNLVVPPIDTAAIARELANMRKEKANAKDKELEELQSADSENLDQEWIIFLCFLTACSAALLTIVAYRLQHF